MQDMVDINKIDENMKTKPQFFEVTSRQRELMQKNIQSAININMSKVSSDAENLLKKNMRYNQVSRTKLNRMIRL
jgi:predicted XRE-type DNA-binding protein